MKTALPSHEHHGKSEDPELMIPAIVGAESIIGNTVAVIPATLLPGAMIGLPIVRTIALPGYLLLTNLFRIPLPCRLTILMLRLLPLVILLALGLLLLLLLPWLIALAFGLRLLLALLILMTFGLRLRLPFRLGLLLLFGLFVLILMALVAPRIVLPILA